MSFAFFFGDCLCQQILPTHAMFFCQQIAYFWNRHAPKIIWGHLSIWNPKSQIECVFVSFLCPNFFEASCKEGTCCVCPCGESLAGDPPRRAFHLLDSDNATIQETDGSNGSARWSSGHNPRRGEGLAHTYIICYITLIHTHACMYICIYVHAC